MNVSLGGLIKTYRINRRLSQFDVASAIGWKDTSRLSKIEQGRVKPTRQIVEKIISALNLNPEEGNAILFAGNYVPTNEEIKKILSDFRKIIDNWPYPAYLIDFTWRFLYCNRQNSYVFHVPEKVRLKLPQLKPNLLEYPFFPKEIFPVAVYKGEDESTVKPFTIAQVAQFKIEQRYNLTEPWCKKLISHMMRYDEFRKIWSEIKVKDYQKKLLDYEFKIVEGEWGGRLNKLKFHIFTSRVIDDPRFQSVLYVPADLNTKKFFAD